MCLLLGGTALPAWSQQAWLQIEAQPNAAGALSSARAYAERIDRVEGYALENSRWHAVVVGPYDEDEIADVRRSLRSQQLIPADSFTTDGLRFAERIFPGEGDPAEATATSDEPDQAQLAQAETSDAPEPTPPEPDETPAEARASEAALSGESRRQLQIALRWAGVYDAGIDGAFGRGTRAAMRQWQEERGLEGTGVLTTGQRETLLREYNAVLDGLGLRPVKDDTAGITVEIPTRLVTFEKYEPPFAHYAPRDGADLTARVLLISQRGQQADMNGLYDIMQTLEIVPTEGERERRSDGFSLTGRGEGIVSQTEVRLDGGQIKGFTLIWPEGDEDRRTRVVDEMQASFQSDPAQVLDDSVGAPGENQSIDLLAGLRIRTPEISRSGFYVSRRGEVLTTIDATQECDRITLDDDVEAEVRAVNAETGLALLSPSARLAPRQHATFREGVPRLGSDAVLSGYSYDGQLGAPSLTYGTLAAMSGLDGDETVRRYAMSVRPGDSGGPIFDRSGTVLGMLTAPEEGARTLPDGVAFGADVETIATFLDQAGVEPRSALPGETLARGLLERRATDMTVLVGCWK